MRVKFRRCCEPELREPWLVSGLPGIGFVAKQTVDYLIEKLGAKLFEELYSPYFPSYVLIKKDGAAELMKNEFYFWENTELKNDIIFLSGNAQPLSSEGQYEMAEEIVARVEKLGVRKMIILGAYVDYGRLQMDKPKIYGTASNSALQKMLADHSVQPLERGAVEGYNGLLLGIAKLKRIDSICLLCNTIDYATVSGHMVVDAKSALMLLEVLIKILDVKVDLADITKKAEKTEEFIQNLEKIERQVVEELSKNQPPKQTYYI